LRDSIAILQTELITSQQQISYYKNKHLIPKESDSDLSPYNFYVPPISGKWKIDTEKDHLYSGAKLQATGGYNFTTNSFTIGPAIKFDFNKFSIKGSYQYNTGSKRWNPSISVDKDIIKF
jgi:hypothetical protein